MFSIKAILPRPLFIVLFDDGGNGLLGSPLSPHDTGVLRRRSHNYRPFRHENGLQDLVLCYGFRQLVRDSSSKSFSVDLFALRSDSIPRPILRRSRCLTPIRLRNQRRKPSSQPSFFTSSPLSSSQGSLRPAFRRQQHPLTCRRNPKHSLHRKGPPPIEYFWE